MRHRRPARLRASRSRQPIPGSRRGVAHARHHAEPIAVATIQILTEPSRIPFIGLTGGLGSGKSTALAALERRGAATLSTDAVVHELYDGVQVRDAVVERWGPGVAPDGVVDRNEVARHAFADPAERAWLEGLLWPLVGARIAQWREALEESDPPPAAAVVETPLLFEAGMDAIFDATIAIVADEDLRAARAQARGHHAVDERASRQLTQEEKAARATHVVRNDGTVEALESDLAVILQRLRR